MAAIASLMFASFLVHEKTQSILYQCSKCHYQTNNHHQHFLNHMDLQHPEILDVTSHWLNRPWFVHLLAGVPMNLRSDRILYIFKVFPLPMNCIPYDCVCVSLSDMTVLYHVSLLFDSFFLASKRAYIVRSFFSLSLSFSVALCYSILLVVFCCFGI